MDEQSVVRLKRGEIAAQDVDAVIQALDDIHDWTSRIIAALPLDDEERRQAESGVSFGVGDAQRALRIVKRAVERETLIRVAESAPLDALLSRLHEVALTDQTKEQAIAGAVKEYTDLMAVGEKVSKKDRERAIEYIATKWGVSPDDVREELEKPIEPATPDQREFVRRTLSVVVDRLPAPIGDIARRLRLEVWKRWPHDPDVMADVVPYFKPSKAVRIFWEGIRRNYGRDTFYGLATTLAHELWHAFNEHTKFYARLWDVLNGKMNHWLGVGKVEIEDFLNYLSLLEKTGIGKDFVQRLRKQIEDWGGQEYELEVWESDHLRGIMKRVKLRPLVAMLDEMMGEALARIALGEKVDVPTQRVVTLVSEIGGVPGVVGRESDESGSSISDLALGLKEVTTTAAIARYPTPFKKKKSVEYDAPATSFDWDPERRAWVVSKPPKVPVDERVGDGVLELIRSTRAVVESIINIFRMKPRREVIPYKEVEHSIIDILDMDVLGWLEEIEEFVRIASVKGTRREDVMWSPWGRVEGKPQKEYVGVLTRRGRVMGTEPA